MISETHLIPLVSDATIAIPGFVLFRNDSGSSPKHGVCMYVKESFQIDRVDLSHNNCLSLRLAKLDVYVYIVYRPPSNSPEQNQALTDFLLNNCGDKEVIIMGDFNLPSIAWDAQVKDASHSGVDVKFLDTFNMLGLTQWVNESTFPRSGNILDLALTSEEDRVGQVQVHPPPPGCDHCSVYCEYIFDTELSHARRSSRLLWHRGQYGNINSALSSIDWTTELAQLSSQEAYSRLLSIIEPLIEQFVPKGSRDGDRKPPWKSNPPSTLKRHRREAWKVYKDLRSNLGRKSPETVQALQLFLKANSDIRLYASRQQIEYERSLINRSKENPKLLHSYIRHKKRYRSSIGPLLRSSNDITDDPKEMADCLLESFANVHTEVIPENPAPHQHCEATLGNVVFLPSEVHHLLSELDPNSAMGLDGLHPRLLKSCAKSLACPLYMIFCQSLLEGKLPLGWKSSLIVPIFKKGSRLDPKNYRPVSLTSVPCKSLERLISRELYAHFSNNNVLSDEQFGFRPDRSTEDQLLLAYNEITTDLDSGHPVDLIMFDFSKAFDVVCHAILLEKLRLVGIHGVLLAWLHDFLVGRQMQVLVKDTTSAIRAVRSGVPQGSVLGPILFLVYINHVASELTCSHKIFADDLKVFMKLDKEDPLLSTKNLQKDIDLLHTTASSWGLAMNVQKCAVLCFRRRYHSQLSTTYTLAGTRIPHVSSYTDLGVVVDDDMKFHEHCILAARKAGGAAHSFLRSTRCRTPDFMLFIWKSHIRPILEYASPVWHSGYIQDLRRLEGIQRLWTRNILGLKDKNYRDRLRALSLYSVKGRLLRADLLKCWKIFHGHCQIFPEKLWCLETGRRTRGHMFKIRYCRAQIDARARFFTHRIVNDWNGLPANLVQEPSLHLFKNGLAEALGTRLYEYHD